MKCDKIKTKGENLPSYVQYVFILSSSASFFAYNDENLLSEKSEVYRYTLNIQGGYYVLRFCILIMLYLLCCFQVYNSHLKFVSFATDRPIS